MIKLNELEKACLEARLEDVRRLCSRIKHGRVVYYAILGGCAKCLEYVIIKGYELDDADVDGIVVEDLNDQMVELVEALMGM
jgi:hypothetical protein